MPLRGEDSLKSGIRFEDKWTVYYIAKVLDEQYDSIHLAPPGNVGRGCEFVVKKGDLTEYHQVRRQQASGRSWSVADLARDGVWEIALEKTEGMNSIYVFFSSTSVVGGLYELTVKARGTPLLGEFRSEVLKGERNKCWRQLLNQWNPLISPRIRIDTENKEDKSNTFEQEAFERLKKIYFYNEDEYSFTEKVDLILRTLIRADPEKVRNDLTSFALENVTKKLYAEDIWSYLESRGYRRADYSKDASVLAAIQKCNQRYAKMITHIRGSICIHRQETDKALNILLGDGEKQSVLVSGEAGIGKSVVLGQVIKEINEKNIPHLYFRVDRLNPTDRPHYVGSQLGLRAAPVEVLGGFAKNRPSILIIDQLDAVSLASGRKSDFFPCIHEIIEQVKAFPNMRLLMACRSFDLEKDNRLRELIAEDGRAINISIELFTIEKVKFVLQELGFTPSFFSNSQMNLLQLPFHLSLFAQVAEKNRDQAESFTTSIDLFNAYWKEKLRAVKIICPQKEQWVAVIDRLCEEMTEQQALSIEESIVLDDFEETIRAMETEHVLISDGRKIGFFHDSFFDYVFARRFIAKKRDLIEYLISGEQHLFKRFPMRQILMYVHTFEPIRFIRYLRRLLTNLEIRFHLKKAALEVAEIIDYASSELWRVFSEILTGEDTALSREVWWVLINSKAWFPFLFKKELLADWLESSDDVTRGRALRIILTQIQFYPDESVKLLEPYVGRSPEWNREILQIIHRNAMHESRAVFELFINMVENDAIDEEDRFGFWTCIDDLPRRHPDWTAEAVGIYLLRVLDKVEISEIKKRFLGRDRSGVQLLPEIAQAVPIEFLENVLPFFLKIVSETSQEKEGRLLFDPIWSIRMCWPDSYNLENALLIGLETALKKLAKNSPEKFSRYMEKLSKYGDYDSVNFLLIRAFSVSNPEFADRIIDYVIENPRRLECGWSGGASGDYRYWAARELIEHVSQHCSDESFNKIEKTILEHYPRFELSKDGLRARGYWQLIMLSVLDLGRSSILVKDRIRELWRKFSGRKIIPPQASRGGTVHTPIPEQSAEKMTDEQWLSAIRKYNKKDSDWPVSSDFLKGNAVELSRVLEEETKKYPDRFIQLGLQLPEESHRYYYGAILRGLNDSDIEKERVFEVVRRFFSLPEKPGARWMPDLIKKYSNENIPEDILNIVGWLATEADDPENDELTSYRVNGADDDYPHDLFGKAINSIRGTAAEAIGQLIADNSGRIPFFMPYIERMVEDPTVVVRTTVACALRGLCVHNEELAVTLFIKLSETDNDAIFATPHTDQFLYYAASRHFERLNPILRRMVNSTLAIVREAGARHACIAFFKNPKAEEMVAECLTGDEPKRRGAVRVAAANVGYKDCQEFSHSALVQFFNDPVKEIRNLAANCFRETDERQLESCRDLIRSFIESKAFEENIDELMMALKQSTADIAEEILDACEAGVAVLEKQGAGLGSRLYFEGGDVAELVLRSYSQSDDERVRSRCLDLIDRLLSIEAYGIKNELDLFQR